MSLENVQAFYERIADDKEFLAELQATETQEEGKKILEEAGYDFTSEELEEYTSQVLESSDVEDSVLEDLNEEQMAAVFGGLSKFGPVQALYGVIWWPPKPWPPIQPMYGIVVDTDL
ncbi:MAG: Nif11-like leader peptide family natural product precursor [Okeania sp. SIO3B5]|uniref:Nif11-like leader peptide family natural product precursor n=1 Tax=Okeania sp. SIO3B5 TaxID=2607811 RepID=UPI0013FE78D3|nr:Nif11-like leader peptide family natural product precursor [Okeania sp. SIO3B5]NEO55517.1 Nif11-like leader peptide family natural product precursor [Okeania sp. SIO3B5]